MGAGERRDEDDPEEEDPPSEKGFKEGEGEGGHS